MLSPLTRDAVSDPAGRAISHALFANATFFFIMTLIALFQRRNDLYPKYVTSSNMSSLTFPFVNTANASNVYRINFLQGEGDISPLQWVLSVWVNTLTALATCIVLYVLLLYILNGLFVERDDPVQSTSLCVSDTVGENTFTSISKTEATADGNNLVMMNISSTKGALIF